MIREHEFQMLQASLYKQVQKLFSDKNCLVFLNRADEFFVISNGLELDDQLRSKNHWKNHSISVLTISIGYGETPFDANLKAYEGKKNEINVK